MNKRRWLRLGLMLGAVAIAYFGNVALQTHLGERAREARTFEALSLDRALRDASANGKPVLAVLSAVWCPSCRKLDEKVFGDSAVAAHINQNYVFAEIEYESREGEVFMARHGVSGFPNILILDAKGDLERKMPLTFDPATFLEGLKR